MTQEVLEILKTCVVIPLLTTLTGFIIAYISRQIDRLKTKIHNEKINNSIDAANEIITQVVTYMNQTIVDGLKAEGKFDKKAQKETFDKAKRQIYQMITDDIAHDVMQNYIDTGFTISDWIDMQIENKVNQIK